MAERGTKCCPNHPAALNRAERRHADRHCACRGECGWHPHRRTEPSGDTVSAAADRFHALVTRLESEGHHLADEARDLFEHFVGPDTPTPAPVPAPAPVEPAPVEPPAAA